MLRAMMNLVGLGQQLTYETYDWIQMACSTSHEVMSFCPTSDEKHPTKGCQRDSVNQPGHK